MVLFLEFIFSPVKNHGKHVHHYISSISVLKRSLAGLSLSRSSKIPQQESGSVVG
jgi:hypothetical protein